MSSSNGGAPQDTPGQVDPPRRQLAPETNPISVVGSDTGTDTARMQDMNEGIRLLSMDSYNGDLSTTSPTSSNPVLSPTSPSTTASSTPPLSSSSASSEAGPSKSAPTSTTTTPILNTNYPLPPPLLPRATAPAALPLSNNSRILGSGNLVRAGSGLRAGVRGGSTTGELKIPPSIQAKMAAMASRSSSGSLSSWTNSSPRASPNLPPPTFVRPGASAPNSRVSSSGPMALPTMGFGGGKAGAPVGGMKKKRPGMTLTAMSSGIAASEAASGSNGSGAGNSFDLRSGAGGAGFMRPEEGGTPFSNFRKIVDPSGRLNFASKAVVHADGVDFSSGASFKIKMADFELYEELGKGNYGTVQKVWHKPTKVTMALKEIRLELDDSKLKTIITELDILHRATSPYIIDFYGAFFIESCVYYCMEYMDAGSLEKVAGCDVPEEVLSRVTRCMVEGLRFLKDELKIMHRDVKPTNVLINRKGAVKLCDFGVSGQLDRSLAKTNIGCQSYMAPERIKGESQGAPTSYTASSDVWSLGLSIIEFAVGHYPYPPETYTNVFAQLTAIVHGDPPSLPASYSETAREFVAACLIKVAKHRPTYAMLLEHPFLKDDVGRDVDMVGWIAKALDYRTANPRVIVPALA